jgi:polar amino acid transport system substrate-binding protein
MRTATVLAIVLLSMLLSCGRAAAQPLKIYATESPPLSFRAGTGVDGLAAELVREVQRRVGGHEVIEILPWSRSRVLAAQTPNVLQLSLLRTPEREREMRFFGPWLISRVAVLAARSRAAELRNRDPELRSLRTGVRRASATTALAHDAGFNVTDEINTSDNGARMLMLGRFELWFESEELALGALQAAGYKPGDVEVLARLSPQPIYFAFSKGTPEALIQAWDAALRDMKRDGSFQRIHSKWLPGYEMPADAR